MAEGLTGTRVRLERAVRPTATHPVVDVLMLHQKWITEFRAGMVGMNSCSDQFDYIDRNSGRLAKAIGDIGNFSLKQAAVVTIFSRGREFYPYLPSLANMVFTSYSVAGLQSAAGKGFPSHYAEHHSIPTDLEGNESELSIMKCRLDRTQRTIDWLTNMTVEPSSPQRRPLDELLEEITKTSNNTLPYLSHNVAYALSHLTHRTRTATLS
jgi:hypothetical protein